MRIYIASKTKHAARWRELRDVREYPITATWIDEAGEGETKDRADLAVRCIREACEADFVILYYEPGEYLKGAFIEVGAALAANVQVYVAGEPLPETSVFRSHPCWHQAESVDDVLLYLGDL